MIVTAGSTNVSVYYYIVQDASATSPGEPVTGLLFSDIETGGSASYARQGAVRVDLTLITLSGAAASHADGGFILVDDTNMPGLYRCDYPDAAFVTGADQVFLQLVVASGKNAVAAPILVDITDVDLRDSVRGGMTALPNAAADAAGGLPISDAGGLDMDDIPITSEFEARTLVAAGYFDPAADTVATVTTVTNQLTAATVANQVWDTDATGRQTAGTFGQAIGDPGANTETMYDAVVTDAAGTNVAADIIAVKADTAAILLDTAEIGTAGAGLTNINLPNQTMDIVGNITGNLSGSVNSVATQVTADVTSWDGSVVATPTVAGVPEVDVTLVSGAAEDIATATALQTVDDELAVVDSNVDAILVDTGTTIPGTITALQDDVTLILEDTGTTIPASLAVIDANVDLILEDTGTTIPASLAVIDANVDLILEDTGTTLPATLAVIDGNVDLILVDTATTIPAQISALNDFDVTATLTEDYDVNGAEFSVLTGLYAIHQALMQSEFTGTSNTVYKLDNSTTAFTGTLDSATVPTENRRA